MVICSQSDNFIKKNSRVFKTVAIVVAAVLLLHFFVKLIFALLPFPELKEFRERPYSYSFYDRNGNLLMVTGVDNGIKREAVPLKSIPKNVRKSFLKAEDSRFYFHNGIDYISIARAFFQNKSEGRTVSGASTITMQLARIISPSEERNFKAKIHDAINALKLEARFSKNKILEYYLNSIPFGGNVEGVVSASRYFFGCELEELSLEQCYCLSVIPRRPELYNPLKNPELCSKAAVNVYGRKADVNKFNACLSNLKAFSWPFECPHFIFYLLDLNKNNKIFKSSRVTLDVDLELQHLVEFKIRSALYDNSESSRIDNGACLIIENETGKVLCWVGSNNWFDERTYGQIDGVLVKNQMGSSMKPFLYAACLEKNSVSESDGHSPILEPTDVMKDIAMRLGDEKIYSPLNFNNKYNGPVLPRRALASSLNVPAVYLLSEYGIDNYLSLLINMGFDSLKKNGDRYGWGLALGAGEVTLKELVTAFSVFARDGVYRDLSFLPANEHRIYSKDSARIICSILSDKSARVGGFGFTQTFETDYPSIFKTGTANQYQNIVALGSTDKYTVGVWMGNFDGNTVIGKTGSSLPASVAKSALDFLTGGKTQDFKVPENYVLEDICYLSGMSAGNFCNHVIREYVAKSELEEFRSRDCTWHVKDENGTILTVYPAEYQRWYSEYALNSYVDYNSSDLAIVSPSDGTVYIIQGRGLGEEEALIQVVGGQEDILDVYVDGKLFMKAERPFIFNVPLTPGYHEIHVSNGNEEDDVWYSVE